MGKPKVKDFDAFFRFVKEARKKRGYKFEFMPTPRKIRTGKKTAVEANMICHVAVNKSILSPFEVVWNMLCGKNGRPMPAPEFCARDLGLSDKKFRRLRAAAWEGEGHNTALRSQLLKAAGLKEVPHPDRVQHKTKKKKGKKK